MLMWTKVTLPLPEGLEDANVVRGSQSETIRLVDSRAFFTPIAFTASDISLQCAPAEGVWQTIALPFTPEGIPSGMQVMEFSSLDDSGMPVFTATHSMQRQIPYLFHTDGNTSPVLSAHDARISPTRSVAMVAGAGETRFCATTMGETQSDVLVLNADGDTFVASPGQVKVQPFRAYFSMPGADRISLLGADPDGLTEKMVDKSTDAETLYNLSGQRVVNPRRGIYIRNHKKVLIW